MYTESIYTLKLAVLVDISFALVLKAYVGILHGQLVGIVCGQLETMLMMQVPTEGQTEEMENTCFSVYGNAAFSKQH